MSGQVVCPGLVACGVEVYAVLGGVVIVLAAVGGIGQHLAHIDEVAALAQRHIGQQVVGGGNAGVIQAGLTLDDILLHAGNGLDIEGNAGVKLLAQHVDQTLVVSDEALLATLHDQVVGAHQDIQVIRLAGHDGLHRGLGGSGDGILHADVIDEGLHACADIGGIVGIFVAGIVDAQA